MPCALNPRSKPGKKVLNLQGISLYKKMLASTKNSKVPKAAFEKLSHTNQFTLAGLFGISEKEYRETGIVNAIYRRQAGRTKFKEILSKCSWLPSSSIRVNMKNMSKLIVSALEPEYYMKIHHNNKKFPLSAKDIRTVPYKPDDLVYSIPDEDGSRTAIHENYNHFNFNHHNNNAHQIPGGYYMLYDTHMRLRISTIPNIKTTDMMYFMEKNYRDLYSKLLELNAKTYYAFTYQQIIWLINKFIEHAVIKEMIHMRFAYQTNKLVPGVDNLYYVTDKLTYDGKIVTDLSIKTSLEGIQNPQYPMIKRNVLITFNKGAMVFASTAQNRFPRIKKV